MRAEAQARGVLTCLQVSQNAERVIAWLKQRSGETISAFETEFKSAAGASSLLETEEGAGAGVDVFSRDTLTRVLQVGWSTRRPCA